MVKGLAEEAVHLPWLSPGAAFLAALATTPGAAGWSRARLDPGGMLLLVRHSFPPLAQLGLNPIPLALHEPDALTAANTYLRQLANTPGRRTGFASWSQPTIQPIYQASLTYARVAFALAQHSKRCNPEVAWICGLLAPLGWQTLAAIDPTMVAECLEECRQSDQPHEVQRRFFELDAAALARRVNQRWRLPGWLGAVTGHLALPAELAVALGAEVPLFLVTQLSVALVDGQLAGLKLACGGSPTALCHKLEFDAGQVHSWIQEALNQEQPAAEALTWQDPAHVALLPELLELAIAQRTADDAAAAEVLQQQMDALHEAVQMQRAPEHDSLRQQKLTALAEFAAGAAHEINNPLAVISGQAQYLLGRETDLDRREVLQKIIKQTQRISGILTEVMLFARPAPPKKRPIDVGELVREVAVSLQGFADERKVKLVCPEPALPITLDGDPEQISRALSGLLRNAIEAAPETGWAGVRVETPRADLLHLIVEDNGRGPNPSHHDLLFDPFFSGRDAGRGRGLGLPIAWRLARLHDGDVVLAECGSGTTRFILSLPIAATSHARYLQNGLPGPTPLPLASAG
jgi:signal transduction histidine kinase